MVNPRPVLIRCCSASGCRSAGSEALRQALQQALQRAHGQSADQPGAGSGEGAPAALPQIKPVGCLRLCGRGPLLAVDRDDGSTLLFGAVEPGRAAALLAETPESLADSLADCAIDADQPFFALQRPVVLENCGRVDPESIDDAIAQGSYQQLRRVLEGWTPEQVREQIRRSGLRGRGGAGYPTGLKWDTVALQPPGPR
jgi:bidirectional [NiFe] hydrogenase diaphorase subunit